MMARGVCLAWGLLRRCPRPQPSLPPFNRFYIAPTRPSPNTVLRYSGTNSGSNGSPNAAAHIVQVSNLFKFSSRPEEEGGRLEVGVKAPEKLSLFKRFKQMYKDYWYVLLPVHIITSLGWFGGFYYIAESGMDLVSLAESLHLSESFVVKLKEGNHSTTGYLAIAYLLYKIATPLRYTVTLGGTTVSINYLKKWGYIKPTKELKKMFDDKREVFKEKKQNMTKKFVDKFSEKKRS